MKALLFTSSYPIEGSNLGIFIRNIAEELVKQGVKTRVLVYGTENKLKEYTKNGVEIVEYPYSLIFRPLLHEHKGLMPTIKKNPFALLQLPFYFISSIYHLVKYSKDVDLVHAQWFVPAGFIAAASKFLYKKKLITTAWGAEFHLKNNFLNRSILNFTKERSDKITSVSNYLKNKGNEYINLKNCEVISNGIDLKKFKSNKKEGKKIIIGTARRLVPEKRIDDLIYAFSKLDNKLRNNCELWIIGGGPEEGKLRNIIGKLNLKNVKLFGHVDNKKVIELLGKMHIFVNPSIQEGMATAVLEAMASKCVVVATKYCANDEVIVDGVNGLLYNPDNIDELKNKLELLIKNFKLRDKLSKKGYEDVREYSIDKIVKKYISIYKK